MFFENFTLTDVAVPGGTIRLRHGGSGPPLLLLHGNPQTHAMWNRVAPALAERFTVIAPDLRGYGGSFKPEATKDHAPYSKREMAKDLVAVMEHFGHEPLQGRQPRSRRAGRASPGARPSRAGREARGARYRADDRALRARQHGIRDGLLPLVLVRPAASDSRVGDRCRAGRLVPRPHLAQPEARQRLPSRRAGRLSPLRAPARHDPRHVRGLSRRGDHRSGARPREPRRREEGAMPDARAVGQQRQDRRMVRAAAAVAELLRQHGDRRRRSRPATTSPRKRPRRRWSGSAKFF